MIILISTDLLSSFCPTSLKWLNIDSDVCSPLTIWVFSIEIAFPTICACVPIIVIPLLNHQNSGLSESARDFIISALTGFNPK